MSMNAKLLIFFCWLLLLVSTRAGAKCPCEPEESGADDKNTVLKYKIGGIFLILVAGAIGVCLPFLSHTFPALNPDKNIFFVIKAFAAGVILSTGFMHVLPDAFDKLRSPCLDDTPWEFPFTGLVAMVAAIGTLMIDAFATSYYQKSRVKGSGDEEIRVGDESSVQAHTHATHGHAHGSVSSVAGSDLLRHRVISQVLELGIVVHSVIIGISLGTSATVDTARKLLGALTFHQFFEGMGLGGCISQAKFKCRTITVMVIFFSLTTPVGIAIGIGISKGYNETGTTALIVQGMFNAASAGILIYMSLVDLLAADFMNPRMQSNGKLQLMASAALLLGAACMSIMAKWA